MITGVVILDHWGVVEADVAIRDGKIRALGKAYNPETMSKIHEGRTDAPTDFVIGPETEVISGKGRYQGRVNGPSDTAPRLRRHLPGHRWAERPGRGTARHLATRGARHLALVPRRGARAPEAAALLADLESAGVTAHVHTAVVAAKVRGAEILHELTRNRPLDLFVVHSSVAALIGNQHQAPYAAADLCMEALMRRRRDHGQPGLALAWGGISETGHFARTRMADTIIRSGIGASI